jgi:hypothetical protein
MDEGLSTREWMEAFNLGAAIIAKAAIELKYIDKEEAEKCAEHARGMMTQYAEELGVEMITDEDDE